MSEAGKIAEQLRRAFEGEAWHGPSVLESLAGVDSRMAARYPIRGAHSIWEITLHISAWVAFPLRRMRGEVVNDVPTEQDWPPVRDTSPEAWRKTLDDLGKTHRVLCGEVARLSDAQLDATVPGKDHSLYVMLHGVVQHNLYHAGQIALLKKALV